MPAGARGAPAGDRGAPAGARQRFDAIAARVNTWGRWGDGDERGTLNLVDDVARRRAAECVRSGRAFALGLPLSELDAIVPDAFAPGRVNPRRTMTEVRTPLTGDPSWACTSEDVLSLSLQCATHWDALAHMSYRGVIYNGFEAGSVDAAGARRCGIDRVGTLVTRGILLDVARASGVDRLAPAAKVTPADLDAACLLGGLQPEPGDAVLVRTGHMALLRVDDPGTGLPRSERQRMAYAMPSPGLTMACAEWFHDAGTAAVATDTLALEVLPGEDPDLFLPVHLLHLVEMGLTQGQNWVLDELAADCAADGVYQFLLDATPLPVRGGLGSPLQPVAIK